MVNLIIDIDIIIEIFPNHTTLKLKLHTISLDKKHDAYEFS